MSGFGPAQGSAGGGLTSPVAVADGGTGATSAGAARTNLGLAIGTDVQAHDAELAALAGLVSAADRVPYFTGSGTAALTPLTAFARTLLDDADAATARATLGAGAGDVVGPASSTDNAVARFDSTTGKLIQNSAVTVADTTGMITTPDAGGLTIGADVLLSRHSADRVGLGTSAGRDDLVLGSAHFQELVAGTEYVKCWVDIGGPTGGGRAIKLASNVALKWDASEANSGSLDVGLARGGAGVLKVTDGAAGSGIVQAGVCLGRLKGANFNVTTDQAIPINSSRYVVRKIVVNNASISLTTAAGGVYTATAKGGTALVAAGQVYSALTASTKFVDLTLEAVAGTDVVTATTLYLSLTTAQGAAATADVYVYGDALP